MYDDGYRFSALQDPAAAPQPIASEEDAPDNRTEAAASEPELAVAAEAPTEPPVEKPSALAGSGKLNAVELHAALREFRETVIAVQTPDWELQRSILREGMLEAIVSTRLDDPDDWYRKIPPFQRQSTNPAERKHYLDAICEIVSRLDTEARPPKPQPKPEFSLTAPPAPSAAKQGQLFGGGQPIVVPQENRAASKPPAAPAVYRIADVSESGVKPVATRFYDNGYLPELSRMIAHVVATEGPLYVDQLVTRIARAHGYQRNGAAIVERVTGAIDNRFPRTKDDDRELIWPAGTVPTSIQAFRRAPNDERDHDDIPLIELASLALPHLRTGRMSDEEILVHMRDRFGLARLREATRIRFIAAIEVARASLEASA